MSKKILDEDHYGLEEPKKRIVEYLAVKKLTGNLKSPILCFFGPPGTGKTSLGKSIARALGRKFLKLHSAALAMKRKSADIAAPMLVPFQEELSKECVKLVSPTQFSYSTKSIS